MTKEEFDLWAEDIRNKLDNEEQFGYMLNPIRGICAVYTTDTYESAVSEYDNGNETIAIATTYAKLKGIEIPTIDETPIFWKAEKGRGYYYISANGRVSNCTNDDDSIDNCCYEFGNYFKTKEQAESACKKIKHLLKLQRLHDMLCPDYDGENSEKKYSVIYDTESYEYVIGYWHFRKSDSDVYFTKEAAEKACEILNKEKEND